MKRLLFLSAIAFVSLLSFWGCDKENTEKINNETKGPKIETLSAEKGPLYVVSLKGRVSGLEGVALDFECGIEYSTDAFFAEDKTIRQKVDKKYSEAPYTVNITNLTPDQRYYYRAYYISQLMIYFGEVKNFTFTWDTPQVSTLSAELNDAGVIVCKGVIDGLGDFYNYYSSGNTNNSLEYGIQYSTSESFDSNSTRIAFVENNSNQMGDTIACYIYDFKYDTLYYYRVFFVYRSITIEGTKKSFNFVYKCSLKDVVDLGLSVKWAPFNIGATKPEEYGNYYAWGETESKTDYSWSTYKWCNGSSGTFTKYNSVSGYGTVDNKNALDPEDDVAHVKWGDTWRMPTKFELDELRSNCTWTWTTLNGVNGYTVTSNKVGYTDCSIFLPAAGECLGTYLGSVGNVGFYWLSSLYAGAPDNAWGICFNSGSVGTYDYKRGNGFSVRPVCPSEEWLSSLSISMVEDNKTLLVDCSAVLHYVVKHNDEVVDNPPIVIWSSDNPSVAIVDSNGVVTAISVGTANITASIESFSAKCTVTVTDDESAIEHIYVDLGLSVKWATFNVGATKPEEYGAYYAWGETEPKTDYSWSTYKWCNGSSGTFTKYNSVSGYGTVDNKTTLDPEDDVARVKWGGSWRMPTKAELKELCNNCTWTKYKFDGVVGYKVTSNIEGYTDRSIFLPSAGLCRGTLFDAFFFNYWSSSLETDDPYWASCIIYSSGDPGLFVDNRASGLSVRPVCP